MGAVRRNGKWVEYRQNVEFMRGVKFSPSEISVFTADGQVTEDMVYVELDGTSTGVDVTIDAPTRGRLLVITCTDASNNCTVTCTAGDFDGASGNIATFDAAEETIVVLGISATRFVVLENIGTVVFT